MIAQSPMRMPMKNRVRSMSKNEKENLMLVIVKNMTLGRTTYAPIEAEILSFMEFAMQCCALFI